MQGYSIQSRNNRHFGPSFTSAPGVLICLISLMLAGCTGCTGCSDGGSKNTNPLTKIRKIEDPSTQASQAINIAKKLASKDPTNADEALGIAQKAIEKINEDPAEQANLSIRMAEVFVLLDSKAKAKNALDKTQSYCNHLTGAEKASMLARISGGYSNAGYKELSKTFLEVANDEAGSIEDPGEAISTLLEIAKASNKLKDSDGAASSFDKAVTLAQDNKSPTAKVGYLCQIAKAQISIDNKPSAIKTLGLAYTASKEIPVSSKTSGEEHLPHERAHALMDIIELYHSAKHQEPIKGLLSEANGFVDMIVKPKINDAARLRYNKIKGETKG